MALVAQKARAARELARDYLRPRISPDNDDVAIVDIGWNGRMQSSMAGFFLHQSRISENYTACIWAFCGRPTAILAVTRHGCLTYVLRRGPIAPHTFNSSRHCLRRRTKQPMAIDAMARAK